MAHDIAIRVEQSDPGNLAFGHATLPSPLAQEVLWGEDRFRSEMLFPEQRAFTLWHAAAHHIEAGSRASPRSVGNVARQQP